MLTVYLHVAIESLSFRKWHLLIFFWII